MVKPQTVPPSSVPSHFGGTRLAKSDLRNQGYAHRRRSEVLSPIVDLVANS